MGKTIKNLMTISSPALPTGSIVHGSVTGVKVLVLILASSLSFPGLLPAEDSTKDRAKAYQEKFDAVFNPKKQEEHAKNFDPRSWLKSDNYSSSEKKYMEYLKEYKPEEYRRKYGKAVAVPRKHEGQAQGLDARFKAMTEAHHEADKKLTEEVKKLHEKYGPLKPDKDVFAKKGESTNTDGKSTLFGETADEIGISGGGDKSTVKAETTEKAVSTVKAETTEKAVSTVKAETTKKDGTGTTKEINYTIQKKDWRGLGSVISNVMRENDIKSDVPLYGPNSLVSRVKEINGIDNPNIIQAGDTLSIPRELLTDEKWSNGASKNGSKVVSKKASVKKDKRMIDDDIMNLF